MFALLSNRLRANGLPAHKLPVNRKSHISRNLETLAGNFTVSELKAIDNSGTHIAVEAGRKLLRQGELGRETMLILSGTANVVRQSEVVATVGAGAFVGELAVLTGAKRNASLVAETDLVVAVFTPYEFKQLLDSHPGIDAKVAEVAQQRSAA